MTLSWPRWPGSMRRIGLEIVALPAFVTLAACVPAGPVVETPDGPVLVVEDEDLVRFSSAIVDGVEVEPVPGFGGLLALSPDGLPLTPDDRSRAEIALERHCGVPVDDLSFRGYGEDGLSTWSSAPCDATIAADGGE